MRYIRNISDNQNKVGDTDNIFRFNLLQGEDVFNFGDYPISINIANSSGYILSMVPEKEFGNSVIKLDFNNQLLKSLTPDDYLLEVEVKLPDGTTATFPTKGGMPFSINSNLKNTAGQLVPTVTFDEVLNAVDNKVNNYLATVVKGDKGDKGDTGVVDTTADYTWTGTNTFNKQIIGSLKTREATFTDFATVAGDLVKYAGLWFVSDKALNNSPVSGTLYGVIEVIPAYSKVTGIIRYSDTPNRRNGFYQTTVDDGELNGWHKIADDAMVVHKTGTETIAGDKTFADIISGDITGNAGSATKLQTPRKINGTDFDGTSDINVLSSNDSDIVHKSGNENVNGNKTFTDEITFNKLINGALKTREATFTDFADVAKNMIKYSGNWFVNGNVISNKPYVNNYFVVTITPANYQGSGEIEVFEFISGKHYNANVSSGLLGNWKLSSEDSKVVHNTGTETIAGDKTFTGNNTFTGQTSFWFKQIKWTSGIMQGTWYIQRMGNFVFARFGKSQNTGTGNTSLALPVGYRPINNWILETERGQAGIRGDGTIYIGTAYNDNTSMTFVYPTDDAWPTA